MITIKEIREKYPQYNDLSDEQLINGLHSKFYSDIPKEDYYKKIGFNPVEENKSDKSESQLSKIPGYAAKAAVDLPSVIMSILSQTPTTAKNIATHPINSLKDLLGGIARGSQNLASYGLESGEYLTRKVAESLPGAGKVPYWNAREFMGLEGPNKIDLGKMIESKNPDPLISGIGQYGLGGASGGTKLFPMILANYLTGGIQSPTKENRTENAIRGAVNAAIPGTVIKGISKVGIPASLKKIDYEKPIEQIRSKYDSRSQLNSKEFTDIQNESYNRGIHTVPNVKNIITKIEKEKYLPDTTAFKKLIKDAKTGDYKALRQLQTDLGTFGIKNKNSKEQANINKGYEIMDAREKINDAIHDNFIKTGHTDLAKQLQNARKEYGNIQETYHNTSGKKSTTSTRAISKMVGESRLTPRNPETVFTEKSKPMDKFIKEHPEIGEVLKKSKNKKAQIDLLKKFSIPASVAGSMTGLEVIKYLLSGHL